MDVFLCFLTITKGALRKPCRNYFVFKRGFKNLQNEHPYDKNSTAEVGLEFQFLLTQNNALLSACFFRFGTDAPPRFAVLHQDFRNLGQMFISSDKKGQ